MEQKEYVRPRNINLAFRVTEEERDMIKRRMEQTGIINMRAYIVKMAIDGRVIRVEFDSVREMIRLLSITANNMNQIAKRANETGNIYAADLEELRERYEGLWEQAREILSKFREL